MEPAKSCGHPIAGIPHRVIAWVMDASLLATAVGWVIVVFLVFGGKADATSKLVLGTAAGVTATLHVFFKVLWLLAERDSPGMVWTRLQLLNFDGQTPTAKQRVIRSVASVLSFAAVGLGFLWALADEEKLTWHDHISKTFPSPKD